MLEADKKRALLAFEATMKGKKLKYKADVKYINSLPDNALSEVFIQNLAFMNSIDALSLPKKVGGVE